MGDIGVRQGVNEESANTPPSGVDRCTMKKIPSIYKNPTSVYFGGYKNTNYSDDTQIEALLTTFTNRHFNNSENMKPTVSCTWAWEPRRILLTVISCLA